MMFGNAKAVAWLLIWGQLVVQISGLKKEEDDKCQPADGSITGNTLLLSHARNTPKKILVATPLKNAGHVIHHFSKALQGLTYPKAYLSLAFVISDSEDDTAEQVQKLKHSALKDFGSVQIIEHDFLYEAPEDRHAYAVQAARRTYLAKSRNVLIREALTEDMFAVLWLDADITGFPKTLVEDLLAMGRPIVAPHVLIGPTTYDKNSWRENKPEEAFKPGGLEVVFEGYPETSQAGGERSYLDDLRDSALANGVTKHQQYGVCIDGVGTAALFVQARVHREGVMFPEVPYKKRLESEGFGLWAKDRGFQPCGLPFYEVYHYDEWSDVYEDAEVRMLQKLKNATRPRPKPDSDGPGPKPDKPGPKPDTPGPKVCKAWCRDHKDKWPMKCSWKNCNGCPPCNRDMPVDDGLWEEKEGMPKGNMSRPMKMMCHGPAECRGKQQKPCLQLEREGKCEWAPPKAKGRYECTGRAECIGKPSAVCKRMQKQEGKCKWKLITEEDMAPGECVGKRGQPECDDKDKMVCMQLMREKKCIWMKGKKDRKTPTGSCIDKTGGAPECENKPRRTCVRMIKQEGKKCRWKPNPANEVKVGMTIKNVKLDKMDAKTKSDLKCKIETTIAKKSGACESCADGCVNATLTSGSIKVDAVIDMEEKFGIMEAESEESGKELDLTAEMNSIKSEVQEEVGSSEAAQEILKEAKKVEGVEEAAEGDITIGDTEVSVTAESVTQAPIVEVEPEPAPMPAPQPVPEPATAPAPSPSPITDSENSTTKDDDATSVDAAVPQNGFVSLVITSVAVMMLK